MKRKYPQQKQKNALPKSLSFFFILVAIVVLFALELLVALGVSLPRVLEVAAPALATLAGGLLVFFNIMATLLGPLHRTPRTVLRTIDKTGCFILFAISLFGVFWEPVPQFVLWVNVLILSRWLYDVIASYVDGWRAKGKRVVTDADCPDKIERPRNRRDS